MARLSIILGS